MGDHSKCYRCAKFLIECVPPPDINSQKCSSFKRSDLDPRVTIIEKEFNPSRR